MDTTENLSGRTKFIEESSDKTYDPFVISFLSAVKSIKFVISEVLGHNLFAFVLISVYKGSHCC